MKKIMKFINIISFIILSIITIIFVDLIDSNSYVNFDGYKFEEIDFSYENESISNEIIIDIIELSRNHNIILSKTILNDNVKNVYLSLNDENALIKFLDNIYKLDKQNYNNNCKKASTYDNSCILIKDFLENNNYNYLLLDDLISENGYLYGDYMVYYTNSDDLNSFITDIEENYGISRNSLFSTSSGTYFISPNLLIVIFICVLVVLSLFHYVFQVYSLYYQSKKIGCMKLLGLGDNKVYKNLVFKDIWIDIIVVFAILLLSLFLKNINLGIFLTIFIVNIITLFVMNYVSYASVEKIAESYNVINILKKQNITKTINRISMFLKILFSVAIIVIGCLLSTSIYNCFSSLKMIKRAEPLLDYAVIADFYTQNTSYNNPTLANKLYQLIDQNTTINTIYVDFTRYNHKLKVDEERAIAQENSGERFRFATIDKNYLEKENIKIYDLTTNNEVNIKAINPNDVIIPKSRIYQVDNISKNYIDEFISVYEEYDYNTEFDMYYYEDREFKTYRLEEKIEYVHNPIFRVISSDLPISYIDDPIGLNVFGTGMTTSLKLDISTGKNEVFQKLLPYIEEAGLSDVIKENNFVSYEEYLSDELNYAYSLLAIFATSIIIISLIYLFILFQVVTIFIKTNENKIVVKKVLGFDFWKIYKKLFIKNILFSLITIILALIITNIFNIFDLNIFVFTTIVFIVADFVMFLMFIKLKKIDFNTINQKLLKR